MTTYLLGIDVGTYSSKGVVTDLQGRIMASASVPHTISITVAGQVEQDAELVWWHDVCTLSQSLLAQTGIDAVQIAGVAVSAIGPCLLPLDADMRPLRPAILYGVDVRAEREIVELEAAIGKPEVLQFCKMAFTSQAIGPKICWLKKHEPQHWEATSLLTSASGYLVFKLTGQHRMDRHTASHYMPLYNPETHEWDARYADLVCPLSLLPPLAWADEIAGVMSAQAALETGLAAGTPVAVGTVDALSEALSVGVVTPGDMMVMYGSTSFFIGIQDRATPDPRVWCVDGLSAGQKNLAAGMSTTGSLTRWFMDEFCHELDPATGYTQLFSAATKIAPGCDGLLVLPYFSGERSPINDSKARGEIVGLTLSHTRDHIFRAILEGVGFGIRHNLEAFQAIGARFDRLVAVGGGAQSMLWLQIISDITGVAQLVPAITLGAAYGDAFLAGQALGLLRQGQINDWVEPERMIQPNPSNKARYDFLYAHYLRLYESTKTLVHALGDAYQAG